MWDVPQKNLQNASSWEPETKRHVAHSSGGHAESREGDVEDSFGQTCSRGGASVCGAGCRENPDMGPDREELQANQRRRTSGSAESPHLDQGASHLGWVRGLEPIPEVPSRLVCE